MRKKKFKGFMSFVLALSMLLSSSVTAMAAWQDGLVIPGSSEYNNYQNYYESYENFEYPYYYKSEDVPTVGEGSIISSDNINSNETKTENVKLFNNGNDVFKTTTDSAFEPILANNYLDIIGEDSVDYGISVLSASGSSGNDYLQANGGYITIVADTPLNNILHYDGKIVDNIHIAKWIKGDPSVLEYPAYCKNPGWKGVAQNADLKYQIDPKESISASDKILLGIARAGYPFKTPAELGCKDKDEAYYATHAAIHTAIVNGSLDKWSIKSGDEARNTRVLNALKKIYNEGISNPYTPPNISVKLAPTDNTETAEEDGEWVSNTYHFSCDYPINFWKFKMLGENLNAMVSSGEIEIYVDNKKQTLEKNISGSWDNDLGVKVPQNSDVTVKYRKSLADVTGASFAFYGSIADVDFENCVTYLGEPVNLTGKWQGYIYNTVPYSTDTSMFKYNIKDIEEPEKPDNPDTPSTGNSDKGSLVIEKLDYNTKKTAADAIFHVRGISSGCTHINFAIKASKNAVLPIVDGATFTVSDGVIAVKGIPAGTYEITEVSPPPHYDVAVGKNSQSVQVVNDSEVSAKVIFENKPYGSLTVVKTDADTQQKLSGFFFKVKNHTTGFEQIVETGNNGSVTINNLPEGSYEVTEISARADYILNSTPVIGEVDWGEETTVVLKNKAKPSIEIKKIDSETGEAISGVEFEIKNKNTQQSFTSTTDTNGKIKLIGIDEGWYDVKEITPAEGYIADEEIHEIYAESGKPSSITIKNTKKSSVYIEKVNAEGEALANVSFNIFKFGENTPIPNSPIKTNAQGIAVINNIEPGNYEVQEIAPLKGYLTDNTRYPLKVEEGHEKISKIQIVNHKLPNLTVKKVDSKTGKGLAGAVFSVKLVDGQAVEGSPYTTGIDGTFTIENLSLGKYVITEIKAPNGYEISDPSVQYATMEADKNVVITFSNNTSPDLTIIKVDSKTGETLAGAVFSVEKLEGDNKGFITGSPFTTDNEGKILIPDLLPGAYKITETKALLNYVLNTESRIINLKEGEDFTAKFENTVKPSLTVKKIDSITKDPLKGAKFTVSRAASNSLNGEKIKVGDYVTDVNGEFTINFTEVGWYRVEETEAPNGYVIKEKFKDIFLSAGNDQSITFENSPKSALIIRKIDTETGEALSGVKFEIKYLSGAAGTEGTTIGTYTTSKNGTIVISGLKAGVYSVAEISTDDGHILDETLKTATLADDNSVVTLEFTNAPKGGLLIKKYDAVTKEPLSDVIFKITDIRGAVVGESGGEYRTDETGTIYIPNLVGVYIVSEVKANDGYMLDNTAKTIYIEKGRVYSLEFFNQPKNSLIIVKMDGTTKEPLSDAVIKVSTVKDMLIGEYRTDTSGTITVNNLESGTYKIQEIKQPENYILDDTVKLVTLEQNDSKKVELFNYKTASLIINKVDKTTQKVLSGAKFKVSQIDGTVVGEYITGDDGRIIVPNLKPNWYVVTEITAPKGYNIASKPSKNVQIKTYEPSVVTFENYKNATLRIRKTDYVTGDEIENCKFLITRNDGKTYGTYTTDRFGEINLENVLPAGTYIIRETDVPKGYALDTNARKVTLDWGDDKLIEWENYPLASIKIIKTDSENDEPISGVEFEVFDSKKESLGKYTTDSKGKIELSKMFVEGTYYIEESELEGYIPVKGLQTVKTKWGKTTTVEVENEPIMGKVQIHKTAADNNSVTGTLKDSGLRGAKYTIYDSDGKKVETLTTDVLGYATSGWLRYGEYTIKETVSPIYFLLNEETIKFKVENDGETIELECSDKSTLLQTNVEKSGYKETMCGNTIRYDIFNIQNKSLVPLEKFYLHESLPSDAAKITRLFTGTYNQNLNYSVWYKTNKTGEFKLLKDNIFTNKVYEIDCTKGLMSDEYITDIKFEFGSVDVGFREVERPFLYCKVNEELPNGYKFTNKVEVGGIYEMQSVKSDDSFTTSIYAPTINKGKLPKTGY